MKSFQATKRSLAGSSTFSLLLTQHRWLLQAKIRQPPISRVPGVKQVIECTPLMPSEVTPWFTAFKAYSMLIYQLRQPQFSQGILKLYRSRFRILRACSLVQARFTIDRHTNLNELSTARLSAALNINYTQHKNAHLGENVVREKEYRSAMAIKLRRWSGEERDDDSRRYIRHSLNAIALV